MNKMPLWILVILMTGCSSSAKNVQDAVMDALPEAGISAYDQVFDNLTAPHVSQSVSRPMNSLKIFNSEANSVVIDQYFVEASIHGTYAVVSTEMTLSNHMHEPMETAISC